MGERESRLCEVLEQEAVGFLSGFWPPAFDQMEVLINEAD